MDVGKRLSHLTHHVSDISNFTEADQHVFQIVKLIEDFLVEGFLVRDGIGHDLAGVLKDVLLLEVGNLTRDQLLFDVVGLDADTVFDVVKDFLHVLNFHDGGSFAPVSFCPHVLVLGLDLDDVARAPQSSSSASKGKPRVSRYNIHHHIHVYPQW